MLTDDSNLVEQGVPPLPLYVGRKLGHLENIQMVTYFFKFMAV